jgi:quercetin 2,3-dioxygenase
MICLSRTTAGVHIVYCAFIRYIFIILCITPVMIKILNGHYTVDGAGVKLFRVFANETAELTDPFLLLDHFGSDNPKDYMPGFPWHPHRGIETVTYMLKGEVEHADNIGNKGIIGPGDIQWMSAGSGIIHQEMPQGLHGMEGFQLWVNMPAKKKMIEPKYRDIKKNMVHAVQKNGSSVKVISGDYESLHGPVHDLIIDVVYLDVTLDKNKPFEYTPKKEYTTLCFVVSGSGTFLSREVMQNQLIVIRDVEKLSVTSHDTLRFLLVSGKPLHEEIAWGGPIVMNTQEELRQAFRELEDGTFIKIRKKK